MLWGHFIQMSTLKIKQSSSLLELNPLAVSLDLWSRCISTLQRPCFLAVLLGPPVTTCFFFFVGVLGKCRYVYYGKNSEGNRFIRDDQL